MLITSVVIEVASAVNLTSAMSHPQSLHCYVNENMLHFLHPLHLKEFQQTRRIYSFTTCYVGVVCVLEHELPFKNAHTPSCIKAPLLLRITVQHINIKATICSKTTCFAKFRGTLRKNRGTIFSNGASIFPNGASIFSNGAAVWLNFLENSEP